ncbi:MAG TPA: hypothetical protein VNL38_03570 [Candidatus Nitrosotenuis sp.]|nr:hypothetical protein [Candidatus Nitrosotenuis sp.]
MYTCRECEREINPGTEICPFCGTSLAEPVEEAAPQKKSSPLKTILRYAVMLAAMWAFLWYVLPERTARDAATRAEQMAVDALQETHSLLSLHAAAQNGNFPVSLDALPPESFARVKAKAEAALAEGYRLEYTAVRSEPENRILHFVLLARPRNYGFRNFFVDESGVIRATRENRVATANDPAFADAKP